jgi:pyruvate dehydrogenase E2 component (dihydrolipoyllysine-residue acetyltransferase)
MATNVVMEALSPTMEEGRLVEWKKQEGESVAVGDVLAEVETDKAVMELVARAGGTLLRQVVPAGATVPVSELVAVIGEAGEAASAAAPGGANAGGTKAAEAATPDSQATQPTPGRDRPVSMPPAPSAAAATEAPGRPSAPTPAPAPSPQQHSAGNGQAAGGGRVKASPLARRMAAERGIDLGAIAGSGPEGRVVARDLEQAGGRAAPAAAPARAPSAPAPMPGAGPAYTDVPLTQIRKTIAKRLAQSIGPIPTFYLTTEVDMERAWEARDALLESTKGAEGAPKVSFNDLLIKAVALALREHPACNAWWQDDRIRYWNEVHISMAVAIEDGLITPVIRHADRKSLREISAEARDLAGRARERRLAPEEYTGGTFSISNLGMLDIDEFTAVINPPEAGILAIGRIVPKPVAHEGAVQLRRRMRITMSCDHRVIDGATGARFLQTLTAMLENPLRLVY